MVWCLLVLFGFGGSLRVSDRRVRRAGKLRPSRPTGRSRPDADPRRRAGTCTSRSSRGFHPMWIMCDESTRSRLAISDTFVASPLTRIYDTLCLRAPHVKHQEIANSSLILRWAFLEAFRLAPPLGLRRSALCGVCLAAGTIIHDNSQGDASYIVTFRSVHGLRTRLTRGSALESTRPSTCLTTAARSALISKRPRLHCIHTRQSVREEPFRCLPRRLKAGRQHSRARPLPWARSGRE